MGRILNVNFESGLPRSSGPFARDGGSPAVAQKVPCTYGTSPQRLDLAQRSNQMITHVEAATPALCRLQLGSELRQLRLAAGIKGAQVVKKLIWSPSKLTRLETGENSVVEPADVMALCAMYGADPETLGRLRSYAAVTKTKRDWWLSPEY